MTAQSYEFEYAPTVKETQQGMAAMRRITYSGWWGWLYHAFSAVSSAAHVIFGLFVAIMLLNIFGHPGGDAGYANQGAVVFYYLFGFGFGAGIIITAQILFRRSAQVYANHIASQNFKMTINANGIDITSENTTTHQNWAGLSGYSETKKCIALASGNIGLFLPNRLLASTADNSQSVRDDLRAWYEAAHREAAP